jgi:hypothetical protein
MTKPIDSLRHYARCKQGFVARCQDTRNLGTGR